MDYVEISSGSVKASGIVLGFMRIGGLSQKRVQELVEAAVHAGINTFDHADIYGGGKCEEAFGEFLMQRPGMREKIFLGRRDFEKASYGLSRFADFAPPRCSHGGGGDGGCHVCAKKRRESP